MYTLSNILKIFLSILLLFSLTATKPIFAKKIHNVVSKSSALSPLKVHDEDLQVAQFNCQGTLHTQLCVSTLNSLFSGNLKRKSTTEIVSGLVSHIVDMVEISSSECRGIKREGGFGRREKMALDQCLELAEDTILDLNHVLVILKSEVMSIERYKHLNTLLSFAMTNQGTCLEEFVLSDGIIRRKIEEKLHQISNLVSISLDMLEKIPKEKKKKKKVKDDHRAFQEMGFPSWITNKDKRLVQSSEMVYDLVVAQDGSGNYTMIAQAVEAAPESSNKRFIIYIKEGVYRENVQVARKKTMLMFVGDGIGKTIVISNRSVKDLWTLAGSSTVDVMGEGFIGKDMSFENSAGWAKAQAVALKNSANFTVFFRCSFDGFQDTLYVHKGYQFYRECDVYGTVDFIFGDAAVVFQRCNLYAKRPGPTQQNAFTAQGRQHPNHHSGISILNCTVTAAPDLVPVKTQFKTFLGRPWKLYSRTVYLNSVIDDVVDPLGWLEWNGTFALSTLYYGEYMNNGTGADTTNRVKWPGYRVINDSSEAMQFSVASLIDGTNWLPSTNIPFFPGLNASEG